MKNAPVPLRSDLHPRGIPSVLEGLPPSKKRKVELDTDMAEMSAVECLKAHRSGRYFSLENPKNSIARQLKPWKDLEGEVGVFCTEYHACMFAECRRKKAQVLIHNMAPLVDFIGKICPSSSRCARTLLPHLTWKPRVVKGRVTSFATSLEREYPKGFCEEYAKAMKQLFGTREASFVEIFSGENAPLSTSIARMMGTKVPDPDRSLVGPSGVYTEYSEPLPVQRERASRRMKLRPPRSKGIVTPPP